MDAYCPEFSAFWSGSEPLDPRPGSAPIASNPGLSPAQQVALEELAERVSAARSVI